MSTQVLEDRSWVPELTFPARLAIVRNRMGWNAKEAALACGLPPQTWRNWEAGKKPHDFEHVCHRIARATGCSVQWLALGGEVSGRSTWSVSTERPSAALAASAA